MSDQQTTVCPWCQTEIVWDPEIGPEKECPYCYNELDDYRTVSFSFLSGEEEDEAEAGETGAYPDEDVSAEPVYRDEYDETVELLQRQQDEAPECPHCKEPMLYAGMRTVAESAFEPDTPAALPKPFLAAPFRERLFLCPSCFQLSAYLADEDREAVIRAIKGGA
ncbi:hypothetical protein J31TS4_20760 [Paenibacillus sp. J31TS4]|uniref:hypothetical protein n=1 Tax=Paenibacillus sp. J31TS4 TaxID=2807195 RepID=UPI001B2795BD|nr:hypothetical protein [Paenibacillus sp. J31TS4]GIP38796.1 hypothetical protein J31TS4_20760 [Paenibacillus sp. J31TS4]